MTRDYLLRAKAAGLSRPLPEGMHGEELERLLFPQPAPSVVRRPVPEWQALIVPDYLSRNPMPIPRAPSIGFGHRSASESPGCPIAV